MNEKKRGARGTVRLHQLAAMAFSIACCPSNGIAAEPPRLEWIRQFGTSELDQAYRVSADALGNVFVTGQTYGSLDGANAGDSDVFVRKYNYSGDLQWSRQFGAASTDIGLGLAADGLGNVYVSGFTDNGLDENSPIATEFAFLGLFDSAGNSSLTREFTSLDNFASGRSVAVDGLGNTFVTGHAGGRYYYRRFATKFDNAVNQEWFQVIDDNGKDSRSVDIAADGLGHVYLAGYTDKSSPASGESNGHVTKIDESGAAVWTQPIGIPNVDQAALGVAADKFGRIYVTGRTTATLTGPNLRYAEVFLNQYDESGNQIWSRQLSTPLADEGLDVTTDDYGNAYVTGYTAGSLAAASAGFPDAFVGKYDPLGNLVWLKQFPTAGFEKSLSVSLDGRGGIYLAGWVEGDFGGPTSGFRDAFVLKLSEVPEPATAIIAIFTMTTLLVRFRRQRS